MQAPVVRNSTNDWAARKALENMATAASSITNRPEWQSGSTTIAGSTRGPKGEGDPEGKVAAYKAALVLIETGSRMAAAVACGIVGAYFFVLADEDRATLHGGVRSAFGFVMRRRS